MLTGMGSQNRNQLEIHMEKNKGPGDFFFFPAGTLAKQTSKQRGVVVGNASMRYWGIETKMHVESKGPALPFLIRKNCKSPDN